MNFLDPGHPVRTKVCGITTEEDATMAIAVGVDALGFNFFRGSKRFTPFEESQPWIASLAGRTFRVAVVVNAQKDELAMLRDSGCFEAVQFHGDEAPEFCATAGFPIWIRAVRVKDAQSLVHALQYDTPYLLLDTWSATAYGGTGRTLDWDSASEFVAGNPSRRVILAGGLNPGNVGEAIRAVRPHAVDTAGGVESGPGRKEARLVAEFTRAVRLA
jgi:phosphoribosylanthranilate isomerase